nr:HK97 family phage prohead protease [uncultured Undibacterium sp.]
MKTNTFEIRSGGDLRAVSSGKLAGYAAVYGSQSQDLGGFVEVIRQGAFTKSLTAPDSIRALYEHDNQKLLGRVGSGTLKLEENSKGLYFELTLPDTSYARDLGILVERGDISGCSFGFQVPTGGDLWEMRNGQLTRDLITVNLQEITITCNPAYLDTNVAVRSMEAWHEENNFQAFVDFNQSLWMNTI